MIWSPGPPVAGLPMYDLAEVRWATDQLYAALASAFLGAGWPDVPAERSEPSSHADLLEHWRDPQLVFSQTCGLPLVASLLDRVTCLGTFVYRGVSESGGRYRSVVVARAAEDGAAVDHFRGRVPAINGWESLSGWASLGAVVATVAAPGPFFAPPLITGAHVASLQAVQSGRADLASIDVVTLTLLRRHRPSALEGLVEIARGPSVPAPPVITRRDPAIGADAARRVVADALERPGLADALDALGIDGFVPLDGEEYEPVLDLAEAAAGVLPPIGVDDHAPIR